MKIDTKAIKALLAEPDVERIELRPDGTVVVHKRPAFHLALGVGTYTPGPIVPYVDPEPFTVTWVGDPETATGGFRLGSS